ncbi:MAG: PAS domain S-box protein [Blastocatellia bacterium]|nr:PAS domain S-box protein [Blastocatellia bacterium]
MKMKFQARTLAMTFAVLCAVLVGSLNLTARLHQAPVPDDGVGWLSCTDGLLAETVRTDSAADRAGIRKGDVLRAIELEGQLYRIRSDAEVQYFLDEKIGLGGTAHYIVERFNPMGISKGYWTADLLDLPPQPSRLALNLYLGLVGLVYLAIGLYVFFKQEQSPQALHFLVICLLSFIYLFYSFTGDFNLFDKSVFLLENLAFLFVGPAFLHFCAEFPSPRPWLSRHRWAGLLLYLPALLVTGFEVASLSLGNQNLGLLEIRPWLNKAEVFHFSAYFCAAAGTIVITFTQTRVAVLRQQIKWIVWGMTLGILPWLACYAYPFVTGAEPTGLMQALAVGPTILIPLSFGYSIVRYRLMDVDVIVRRSMAYALSTLSLIVLFMLGVVKSAEWTRELLPTIPPSAMTLLQVGVMSLGAILYTPLKNWLQERIDRLFYGEQYDYRHSIADFGRALSATTALPELLDAVAARLSEMLSVNEIAIYVRESGAAADARFRLSFFKGIPTPPLILMDPAPLLASTENLRPHQYQTGPLRFPGRIFDPAAGLAEETPTSIPLGYFFPCIARDRLVAVIGLGRTQNRTLLTSEDTVLLRALTPYVAVAVENSLLYQTEQERIEELGKLKEFNENIIESINVGLLAVDLEGRITNWNSALEELFAIGRTEAEGQVLGEVFDGDLIRTMHDVTGSLSWALCDVRNIYRYRTLARDGRALVLNISLSPLETKDQAVTGALISFEDITGRVRLEEQLREQDKLSSIGLLAAGVAHEVNTPLTGISSYTQMLLTQTPENDTKYAILQKIHRQTLRASDIVNNLLNFSRTGNATFSSLNLSRLLDDTLQLLEPQLRNTNIVVSKNYADVLPAISGHAGKLQQVFMNLILNARDAMPRGGTLTISAFLHDNALFVEFTDTGEGIRPEHITKIYDPFFTTKEVGRGTGLGLAVSYGIIQEHSGRIFVESEPGTGSCFRIKLPCVIAERFQAAGD